MRGPLPWAVKSTFLIRSLRGALVPCCWWRVEELGESEPPPPSPGSCSGVATLHRGWVGWGGNCESRQLQGPPRGSGRNGLPQVAPTRRALGLCFLCLPYARLLTPILNMFRTHWGGIRWWSGTGGGGGDGGGFRQPQGPPMRPRVERPPSDRPSRRHAGPLPPSGRAGAGVRRPTDPRETAAPRRRPCPGRAASTLAAAHGVAPTRRALGLCYL